MFDAALSNPPTSGLRRLATWAFRGRRTAIASRACMIATTARSCFRELRGFVVGRRDAARCLVVTVARARVVGVELQRLLELRGRLGVVAAVEVRLAEQRERLRALGR